MKKSRKIILSILAIFVLIVFFLILFMVIKVSPIAFLKLSKFDYSTSKPFYSIKKGELYYHDNFKFDYSKKAIYNIGNDVKKSDVYVSPDSRFIIFLSKSDSILKILSSKGELIHEIGIDSQRKSGRFWDNNYQWEINSESFLIIKDEIWDGNFSINNKCSIYRFNISANSFNKIISFDEEIYGCFPDRFGKHIYAKVYNKELDTFYLKKINLTNSEIEENIYSNHHSLPIENNEIFINFNKEDFQGYYSYDLNNIILDFNDYERIKTGLYTVKNDSLNLIVSGKSGFTFPKNFAYSFQEWGCFLPGNSFFISRIRSLNFNGNIVIDFNSLKYMKIEKTSGVFFSITNDDCNEFEFHNDIVPKIENFTTSIMIDFEKNFE